MFRWVLERELMPPAGMESYIQSSLATTESEGRSRRGQRLSGLNTIDTVPLPVTGLPFIVEGLKRHCFTASSADPRSIGDPSTALAEITLPVVSTTIATWTVPVTFIFRANSG